MTSQATHLTDPQGWQHWMAPVSTGGQAGSRVWGRDLTGEVPSGRKSGPSSESCWASTFAYGELASDLLIHMNGRVYDYRLGRFLSVDPIISNPANSQSINPYSYIGNNPLSGTDPTGYCAEGTEAKTGSHICQVTAEGAASRIATGVNNGTITKDTTLAQVGKQIGAGLDTVKSALGGMADGLKAAFGMGNGSPGQGQQQANTNPTVEGAPGGVATRLPLQFRLDPPPMPSPLFAKEGSYAARQYADLFVNRESSALTKGLALTGLVLSSFWTEETAPTTLMLVGSVRLPNKLAPAPGATAPHTTFRRDPATGRVTNYETYDVNPRTGELVPVLRFRGDGKDHGGQSPPLILEPRPGKGPGAMPVVPRYPLPEELPNGY